MVMFDWRTMVLGGANCIFVLNIFFSGLPSDFCLWNNHERVQAFKKFLDVIDVHHVTLPITI
ncbi:hypothetical protein Hanom_Chr02g00128781 [Helianthus anomalus]